MRTYNLQLSPLESAVLADIEAVLTKHSVNSGGQQLFRIDGTLYVKDLFLPIVNETDEITTSFIMSAHVKNGTLLAVQTSTSRTIEQIGDVTTSQNTTTS